MFKLLTYAIILYYLCYLYYKTNLREVPCYVHIGLKHFVQAASIHNGCMIEHRPYKLYMNHTFCQIFLQKSTYEEVIEGFTGLKISICILETEMSASVNINRCRSDTSL
jgi:hypothetical protein